MKLSLYQIANEYQLLAEQLMESGGESSEEMEIALRINKENLETKGTNYGLVVKSMEHECSVIDHEIDRLTALKKQRVKAIERLKNNLAAAMLTFEVSEIKTPIIKISFRKSESVEVDNIAQLDAKFITEKTTVSADKAAIKEAIKAGEDVTGARIVTNQNIQIK